MQWSMELEGRYSGQGLLWETVKCGSGSMSGCGSRNSDLVVEAVNKCCCSASLLASAASKLSNLPAVQANVHTPMVQHAVSTFLCIRVPGCAVPHRGHGSVKHLRPSGLKPFLGGEGERPLMEVSK